MSQALMPALLAKGYPFVLPNVAGLYGWEADVLGATSAGYAHEFEIKVSHGDFVADRQKEAKHQALAEGAREGGDLPNFFWYVCPSGLIARGEVPDYAGLIWIVRGKPYVVKKAPRIHKRKLSGRQAKRLARNLSYRLWREAYAPEGWRPKGGRSGRSRRGRGRRR